MHFQRGESPASSGGVNTRIIFDSRERGSIKMTGRLEDKVGYPIHPRGVIKFMYVGPLRIGKVSDYGM